MAVPPTASLVGPFLIPVKTANEIFHLQRLGHESFDFLFRLCLAGPLCRSRLFEPDVFPTFP